VSAMEQSGSMGFEEGNQLGAGKKLR
jgi:hypothetical protein